jgi:hypothetical protein
MAQLYFLSLDFNADLDASALTGQNSSLFKRGHHH